MIKTGKKKNAVKKGLEPYLETWGWLFWLGNHSKALVTTKNNLLTTKQHLLITQKTLALFCIGMFFRKCTNLFFFFFFFLLFTCKWWYSKAVNTLHDCNILHSGYSFFFCSNIDLQLYFRTVLSFYVWYFMIICMYLHRIFS